MEFKSENSEAQVSLLSYHAPNLQTCITNEDIALTSEMSIIRSDVVEVEKTLVIQKKFIVNEKYVVPNATMTFPANPILYENHDLCIDSNATLVSCEGGIQDSQGSGKMELASQESLDSRMDISSQSSHLSVMEYCSQESDVAIEPATNVSIPYSEMANSPQAICDGESSKENSAIVHPPDVLPIVENYDQKDDPTLPPDVIPGNEDYFFDTDSGISSINTSDYVNYEAGLPNEMSYFKYKDSDRRFSTERSLLSREEAVASREAACMSREKAIEEREAVLVSQGTNSRETSDNEVPAPKRLKLIGVFEYS